MPNATAPSSTAERTAAEQTSFNIDADHSVTAPNSPYSDDVLDNVPESVLAGFEQHRVPLLQRRPSPDYYDLGAMQVPCLSCEALHWLEERTSASSVQDPQFTLCCLNGDAQLPEFRPLPAFLYQLLHDLTAPARHFRTKLRAYNSAFAFTSLDCTPSDRGARGPGVQVFQIHGALYHRSGPLAAPDGSLPRYAQLYFYDLHYAADA